MQIRVTDQPAYILHTRDWQNSSLLLNLLTPDYGRLKVLAKGGKNARSRGLMQPFCKLSIDWVGRQELKTLTAIEGTSIDVNESLYLPLLYINELLEALLPSFEASPEIFALYDQLLGSINITNGEIFLREFEQATMQFLGYMPDTSIDAMEEKPIDGSACYQFQASRGFVACSEHDANVIAGELIIQWNRAEYTNPKVAHLAKTVMRCIIDFNLQGKRLKSRDIYMQLKNWA